MKETHINLSQWVEQMKRMVQHEEVQVLERQLKKNGAYLLTYLNRYDPKKTKDFQDFTQEDIDFFLSINVTRCKAFKMVASRMPLQMNIMGKVAEKLHEYRRYGDHMVFRKKERNKRNKQYFFDDHSHEMRGSIMMEIDPKMEEETMRYLDRVQQENRINKERMTPQEIQEIRNSAIIDEKREWLELNQHYFQNQSKVNKKKEYEMEHRVDELVGSDGMEDDEGIENVKALTRQRQEDEELADDLYIFNKPIPPQPEESMDGNEEPYSPDEYESRVREKRHLHRLQQDVLRTNHLEQVKELVDQESNSYYDNSDLEERAEDTQGGKQYALTEKYARLAAQKRYIEKKSQPRLNVNKIGSEKYMGRRVQKSNNARQFLEYKYKALASQKREAEGDDLSVDSIQPIKRFAFHRQKDYVKRPNIKDEEDDEEDEEQNEAVQQSGRLIMTDSSGKHVWTQIDQLINIVLDARHEGMTIMFLSHFCPIGTDSSKILKYLLSDVRFQPTLKVLETLVLDCDTTNMADMMVTQIQTFFQKHIDSKTPLDAFMPGLVKLCVRLYETHTDSPTYFQLVVNLLGSLELGSIMSSSLMQDEDPYENLTKMVHSCFIIFEMEMTNPLAYILSFKQLYKYDARRKTVDPQPLKDEFLFSLFPFQPSFKEQQKASFITHCIILFIIAKNDLFKAEIYPLVHNITAYLSNEYKVITTTSTTSLNDSMVSIGPIPSLLLKSIEFLCQIPNISDSILHFSQYLLSELTSNTISAHYFTNLFRYMPSTRESILNVLFTVISMCPNEQQKVQSVNILKLIGELNMYKASHLPLIQATLANIDTFKENIAQQLLESFAPLSLRFPAFQYSFFELIHNLLCIRRFRPLAITATCQMLTNCIEQHYFQLEILKNIEEVLEKAYRYITARNSLYENLMHVTKALQTYKRGASVHEHAAYIEKFIEDRLTPFLENDTGPLVLFTIDAIRDHPALPQIASCIFSFYNVSLEFESSDLQERQPIPDSISLVRSRTNIQKYLVPHLLTKLSNIELIRVVLTKENSGLITTLFPFYEILLNANPKQTELFDIYAVIHLIFKMYYQHFTHNTFFKSDTIHTLIQQYMEKKVVSSLLCAFHFVDMKQSHPLILKLLFEESNPNIEVSEIAHNKYILHLNNHLKHIYSGFFSKNTSIVHQRTKLREKMLTLITKHMKEIPAEALVPPTFVKYPIEDGYPHALRACYYFASILIREVESVQGCDHFLTYLMLIKKLAKRILFTKHQHFKKMGKRGNRIKYERGVNLHLIDDLSASLFDITVRFPIGHASIVKAILHFVLKFSTDPQQYAQIFLNQLVSDVAVDVPLQQQLIDRHRPSSPSQLQLPVENDIMEDEEMMETTQVATTEPSVRAAVVEELSEYFINLMPNYQRDHIDFIYNLAEVCGQSPDSVIKKQEMIFRGIISSLTTDVRKQRNKCERRKTRKFAHFSNGLVKEWEYVSRLVYQVILDKQVVKMKFTTGTFPSLLNAYNEFIQEMKRLQRLFVMNRSEISLYHHLNLNELHTIIENIVNFVNPSERNLDVPVKKDSMDEHTSVVPLEVENVLEVEEEVIQEEKIKRKRKRKIKEKEPLKSKKSKKKKRKKNDLASFISEDIPPESEWSSSSDDGTDEELVMLLEKAAKRKKNKVFQKKTPRQLAQAIKVSNLSKAKRRRSRSKKANEPISLPLPPSTTAPLVENEATASHQHFSFRQAPPTIQEIERHKKDAMNDLSFIT